MASSSSALRVRRAMKTPLRATPLPLDASTTAALDLVQRAALLDQASAPPRTRTRSQRAADPTGAELAARSSGAGEPVEPPPRHQPPAIEETIASSERA
ncbi:hypothetical protein WME94_12845 [Sorangium sp. So ce429]